MKELILDEIKNVMSDYEGREEVSSRWKEPVIGFASCEDSTFEVLKKVANPLHLSPYDINPEGKTVITYFLPFDEEIPNSNVADRNSSQKWAKAYVETNILIQLINDHLIEYLTEMGYRTNKLPPEQNMDYEKLTSVWSNRHVGYIAGLGKFGINNMLITSKGCCGRLGNVITSLYIKPTQRSEDEFCLNKAGYNCTKCLDRCVNGALSLEHFDRHKCFEMCTENGEIYSSFGSAEVCGKCLVDLPCSFKNPVKKVSNHI